MKNYLQNMPDPAKLTDVFDELPLWSAPFGLKLLEHVDYKPDITAVDIGFGSGFPLTELAMRLGETSIVYGIDPWKEMFSRVNRKIQSYGITNIRIIEGVAESIPLGNASVDLITSNNGLNNVSDIDRALSECSRICKPGGQFIQTMNTGQSMMEFYQPFEKVLSGMGLQTEIEEMRRHITRKRPPVDGMIARIRNNGFLIRDVVHDRFSYRFADGTAMFCHYFIRLAFMDSWIKLVPPEKAEEIFGAVEIRLNEQARLSGGIKLSIPFVLINAYKR
jgi:SAM-dependent methyltransferase